MRDLTKDDYYWGRAMEEAYRAGFREFAMTLNPYPGAIEHAIDLADMARKVGYEVINVTLVYANIFSKLIELIEFGESPDADELSDEESIIKLGEFLDLEPITLEEIWKGDMRDVIPHVLSLFPILDLMPKVDIITMSVDDMRCEDPKELEKQILSVYKFLKITRNARFGYNKLHFNINLLWTPKVFEWMEDNESYETIMRAFTEMLEPDVDYLTSSVQHLIYKPLSIYESVDWFWEKYNWILENRPEIKIHGDSNRFIGDAALNNMLGLNECPGENMFDVDPMGFVRKCPENPIAFDASNIAKLQDLLSDGIPNCGEDKCNCITKR